MTRGQAVTWATVGAAAMLDLLGLALAALAWFNDDIYLLLVHAFGSKSAASTDARLVTCAALAVGAFFLGNGLFSLQQWIAGQLARRAIDRFRRQFTRIESASGSEAARAWLGDQIEHLAAKQHVEAFGPPDELSEVVRALRQRKWG